MDVFDQLTLILIAVVATVFYVELDRIKTMIQSVITRK